ncbi:MAG: GAF domain-containing protein [Anaerolineae bacterium]|nr:GAF domain-containing protein [Anaerolineae bacterium]
MTDSVQQLSAQAKETTQPVAESPRRKRWSFHFPMRFKLIVAFLGVALIPLASLAYFNYFLTRNMLTGNANITLIMRAQTVATDLDDFIESNQQTLQEVAQWPELVDLFDQLHDELPDENIEYERIRRNLQQLQTQNEYGGTYAVFDRLGNNVITNLATDQEDSKQDYIAVPFSTGHPYISPILFEPTTGEAVWYFSAPIVGREGLTGGVVRVKYSAEVLQQIITQHNGLAGEQSFAVLLDENRVQLANGGQANQRFKSIVPLDPATVGTLQAEGRLPDGSPSELYVSLPGFAEELNNPTSNNPNFTVQFDETAAQLALAGIARVKSQSWQVVFLQPQKAVLAPLRERIFTMGFIVVVIVGVLVVIALNLSKMLSGPLVRLADVIQVVAGGALGLQVPVESRDEVGLVARAVNSLSAQMRELSSNVDQIIAERTRALGNIVRALETSTQIGRQITTILEIDELLRYVVNRIQIEFNFYYTHIYLVEEETGDLVMTEGSGEIGYRLKARGHRLKAGEGIVGTVASSNEYFFSNDVSKVLNFVPNDLLPETRSELALPLRKGNQVLGVLDIQDNKTNRFTSTDVSLMQSIANQAAVAIDNARLLTQTQNALKEVQRLTRRLTREGWDEISQEITTTGYRFSRGASIPLSPDSDSWLPPVKQIGIKKQLVKRVDGDNGDNAAAELAIPLVLRGEVIGVLGVKREEAAEWADEEIAAVEAVANQVTLALENARLSMEQEKTITQLKEVDRLKGEFLTTMSHELRTPLNSIIGFADVILQGIDGEVNELALNDIRLIYNSGQHLLTLINDILDLAKIEAGKMELVREALDIEETVNEILAATGALAKNRPVEIITEIEPELPAIYADKLRFSQVMINLVSNALKFTEKGHIIIKATMWEEDPNLALISVIDNGVGIPPRMLASIFDRFRQVESATTRKTGGTGLGLPICKQLVEMHGGTISVTSKEGVGSNFHFTIPFVTAIISDEEQIITELSNLINK